MSDGSSNVCSSDLDRHGHRDEGRRQQEVVRGPRDAADAEGSRLLPPRRPAAVRAAPTGREEGGLTRAPGRAEAPPAAARRAFEKAARQCRASSLPDRAAAKVSASSGARLVGKEWVRTCKSRWSEYT